MEGQRPGEDPYTDETIRRAEERYRALELARGFYRPCQASRPPTLTAKNLRNGFSAPHRSIT